MISTNDQYRPAIARGVEYPRENDPAMARPKITTTIATGGSDGMAAEELDQTEASQLSLVEKPQAGHGHLVLHERDRSSVLDCRDSLRQLKALAAGRSDGALGRLWLVGRRAAVSQGHWPSPDSVLAVVDGGHRCQEITLPRNQWRKELRSAASQFRGSLTFNGTLDILGRIVIVTCESAREKFADTIMVF
jgi:hypothetical protein